MAGRYRGVTKRGAGWQVAFTLPNGTRCREIVRFPHTRKGEDEAFAIRAQVLAEIDKGTFDYAERFPRSKNASKHSRYPGRHVSVSEALRKYLIRKKPFLAESTYYNYQTRIYKYLIPVFGGISLSDFGPDDVRDWYQQTELSAKSINNILIPLRDVFAEAYQSDMIFRNPLDRVPCLPVDQREPDPMSIDEVSAVVRVLEKNCLPARDYFLFAFGTGLRTSELLALNWSDLDVAQMSVSVTKAIVRGKTKAPKTASGVRHVDLQELAIRAVRSMEGYCSRHHRLFIDPRSHAPWRGGQSLRKRYWYPALREAGVRNRTPYQTRHTYASRLLSDGANPLYVAQQMGHRDWGMIRKVYGRYIGNDGSRRRY